MRKIDSPEHRQYLITLFTNDIDDEETGPCRKMISTEALRKLNESDLTPSVVENWAEGVWDAWMNVPIKLK